MRFCRSLVRVWKISRLVGTWHKCNFRAAVPLSSYRTRLPSGFPSIHPWLSVKTLSCRVVAFFLLNVPHNIIDRVYRHRSSAAPLSSYIWTCSTEVPWIPTYLEGFRRVIFLVNSSYIVYNYSGLKLIALVLLYIGRYPSVHYY